MQVINTLDELVDSFHSKRPDYVSTIMVKNVIIFFDKHGLPRATLTLFQGPNGSVGVDYFDFDNKLPAKDVE